MAGRILIADDVATNRIVLRVKLAAARHVVLQAETGAQTLAIAAREKPDLILLDDRLPDAGGLDVCRALKANAATADIPVIMVTAGDDSATRIAALGAGADEFLVKPLEENTLMARVRSLLRARETSHELRRRRTTAEELGFCDPAPDFLQQGRVALVSTRTDIAETWQRALKAHIDDIVTVLRPHQVLDHDNARTLPDVFVIEADLVRPGDGLQLLSELRSQPATRHAGILIVHDRADTGTAAAALDIGANDLLTTGFETEELALRLKTQMRRKMEADALRAAVEDGMRLAAVDPLTGLYNRRYAMTHLSRIARQSEQSGRPFAVLVADLDWFKSVNDIHGHAAGDAVLREVSQRIRDNLRGVDLVARMGGEEFLIVLPDTDLAHARPAAERLCRLIGETPIALADRRGAVSVTLSIGLAIGGPLDGRAEPVPVLIERADRALYRAKAEGRNQVTVSAAA